MTEFNVARVRACRVDSRRHLVRCDDVISGVERRLARVGVRALPGLVAVRTLHPARRQIQPVHYLRVVGGWPHRERFVGDGLAGTTHASSQFFGRLHSGAVRQLHRLSDVLFGQRSSVPVRRPAVQLASRLSGFQHDLLRATVPDAVAGSRVHR